MAHQMIRAFGAILALPEKASAVLNNFFRERDFTRKMRRLRQSAHETGSRVTAPRTIFLPLTA
jgi:hypothetical protein